MTLRCWNRGRVLCSAVHGGFGCRQVHYQRMSETFQPFVLSPLQKATAEPPKSDKGLSKSQKIDRSAGHLFRLGRRRQCYMALTKRCGGCSAVLLLGRSWCVRLKNVAHHEYPELSVGGRLLLLMEAGLVSPAAASGTFHLLPLFVRSLEKMARLIDREMKAVGCQKLIMPCIGESSLWKTTGRWDKFGNELLRFRDRNEKEFCLSPTHEEAISSLIASCMHLPSPRRFPLRLYQMTTKFRDEMKPKHGLLRAREFLMKDLYTFDCSEDAAMRGYDAVCGAYENILNVLELPFVKATASTGAMGGSRSDEYLLPCETVGEDTIVRCQSCGTSTNGELLSGVASSCPKCGKRDCLTSMHAIEVAHAFLLGTDYSAKFRADYKAMDGQVLPLVMGCFGIGVTRLMAAAVECLSTADCIRWPSAIVPYQVAVISPKAGSKEAAAVGPVGQLVCETLTLLPRLQDEVLWDDRDDLTIGRRLNDAFKVGYPAVVIAGKEAAAVHPKFELHVGPTPRTTHSVDLRQLVSYFHSNGDAAFVDACSSKQSS